MDVEFCPFLSVELEFLVCSVEKQTKEGYNHDRLDNQMSIILKSRNHFIHNLPTDAALHTANIHAISTTIKIAASIVKRY